MIRLRVCLLVLLASCGQREAPPPPAVDPFTGEFELAQEVREYLWKVEQRAFLLADRLAGRLEAGGRAITRELFPHNNYTVQQAARVRFGPGNAARVDRLTIHWPSGTVQVLRDVAPNRHLVVKEE